MYTSKNKFIMNTWKYQISSFLYCNGQLVWTCICQIGLVKAFSSIRFMKLYWTPLLLHLCQFFSLCLSPLEVMSQKNELTSWPSISTLMKWSKSDMSFQWTQQWWMAQTFPSSAKKKRNKWNVRRRRDEENVLQILYLFSPPLWEPYI